MKLVIIEIFFPEGRAKYITEKLSKLPIQQLIKKIKLDELLCDLDAVLLYPSSMWDQNSLYHQIETRYAYAKLMNDELVENFISGDFVQGSAILKIKYYNPVKLIVQHIPVKEKVNKIEFNRKRSGCIIDTSTSVVVQEIVKLGGRVIEIDECVF